MIRTIYYIGGPSSGTAEQLAPEETVSQSILRNYAVYRLAGATHTAQHDEFVFAYYHVDTMPAVTAALRDQCRRFLNEVMCHSSLAVAVTCFHANNQELTISQSELQELSSDPVDAFTRIILSSKRIHRLTNRGLLHKSPGQLYAEFMKQ